MAYRVLLLDIEGTTTSISFVFDVLFPWAAARLEEFVLGGADSPAFAADVAALRVQYASDVAAGLHPPAVAPDAAGPQQVARSMLANLRWQMDNDRKATALKSIQGRMWKRGYESGELRGHLFDDVVAAIDGWREAGGRVAIFSSGSVEAQQLLFGHSVAGDLRQRIDGWFDTTSGAKRDPAAYASIAAQLREAPEAVLFVSDRPEELEAAEGAGMGVVLSVRPGNAPVSGPWRTSSDFGELVSLAR